MSTPPHLTFQLAQLHAADLAVAIRAGRRAGARPGILRRSARRTAAAGVAPVVGLPPPRARRDPPGRDRRVA